MESTQHLFPLISDLGLILMTVFIAWQVFDKVFQPLFIAAVNLLYPGVSYG